VEQPNLLRTLSGVWPGSVCLILHVFYWQRMSVVCVIGVEIHVKVNCCLV